MTIAVKDRATVVLVHGAWADASSWARVIPLLHREGIAVVGVQNPTTSLADDVAATKRAIDAVVGPVVLVGHSWGGTVITEAGTDPKVKALVYVAAFAPDIGQSTGDQVAAHPAPPGLGGVTDQGGGRLMMSVESWIANVAQDLPEAEARVLAATQTPLGVASFSDKVTSAAWTDLPVWYVISNADRAVDVALQRESASRMNARVTTLDTSHMSLLSAPQAVADVILDAVATVSAG